MAFCQIIEPQHARPRTPVDKRTHIICVWFNYCKIAIWPKFSHTIFLHTLFTYAIYFNQSLQDKQYSDAKIYVSGLNIL